MTMAAPLKRNRLDPETRKNMILDAAAEIVADDGLSGVTVERIAQHCAISKSLVYNYFPNLTDLLQALLHRELRRLRRQQVMVADSAKTIAELVRSVTHVYLHHIDRRGLIIERLQAEPSVSRLRDPTEYSRDSAIAFFAEILIDEFALPRDLAYAATDISFGLPAAAGAVLQKGNLSRAQVEDLTVAMLLGSLAHLGVDPERRHRRQRADAPVSFVG